MSTVYAAAALADLDQIEDDLNRVGRASFNSSTSGSAPTSRFANSSR